MNHIFNGIIPETADDQAAEPINTAEHGYIEGGVFADQSESHRDRLKRRGTLTPSRSPKRRAPAPKKMPVTKVQLLPASSSSSSNAIPEPVTCAVGARTKRPPATPQQEGTGQAQARRSKALISVLTDTITALARAAQDENW